MGKKSEPKKKSPPHRRTFPGVRLDGTIERELRQAKKIVEYPLDWEVGDSGLVVSRPWLEGADYREIFREAEVPGRIDFSRDLFGLVLDRLGDLRHGALHPGNVVHVENRPVFLDPVANAARLGGSSALASPTYAVWLWAPRIPAGWEVDDWDRVNLLRMVALLAQGPASWETAPELAAAVSLCRDWAEASRLEFTRGDYRGRDLESIMALLDRLEPWKPPEPSESAELPEPPVPAASEPEDDGFATVGALVSALLERRGGERMLRPEDEQEIRARAPSEELLDVELLRRGVKRQGELKSLAVAFLKAGKYDQTSYIKRSACRNAERLYQAYGVSETAAKAEVQALLRELELRDVRLAQESWSKVDDYVEKHCRQGYRREQLGEMVALSGLRELPREVAENQLRRYLEREKKLRERRGFLGLG